MKTQSLEEIKIAQVKEFMKNGYSKKYQQLGQMIDKAEPRIEHDVSDL